MLAGTFKTIIGLGLNTEKKFGLIEKEKFYEEDVFILHTSEDEIIVLTTALNVYSFEISDIKFIKENDREVSDVYKEFLKDYTEKLIIEKEIVSLNKRLEIINDSLEEKTCDIFSEVEGTDNQPIMPLSIFQDNWFGRKVFNNLINVRESVNDEFDGQRVYLEFDLVLKNQQIKKGKILKRVISIVGNTQQKINQTKNRIKEDILLNLENFEFDLVLQENLQYVTTHLLHVEMDFFFNKKRNYTEINDLYDLIADELDSLLKELNQDTQELLKIS